MNHPNATIGLPASIKTLGDAMSFAIQRHQAGDTASAIDIYREVLRHDPRNDRITYLLAVCEHQAGHYDAAEQLFQEAIERGATFAGIHLARGRNYKQQGKFAEAIQCYRQELQATPDSVDALVHLGVALWRDDQGPEAVDVLKAALQLAPESFEAALNCANALLGMQQYEEAISMYTQALASRPDNPDAHNNLGRALVAIGKWAEGRQRFDRAIELLPSHAEALFNLGDLLFFAGDGVEAEKYYAQAVAARPAYAEGHMALGRAHFDAGRFDQALRSFDRMIELAPVSAAALVWRGIVLREMQRVDEALSAFEKATALSKKPEEGYALVGSTYRQLGDNRSADEFADRALELDPDHPVALNLKGNLALHDADVADAVAWYLKAARADPDFPMYAQNALFAMNYADDAGPAELLGAHRHWGWQQTTVRTPRLRARTSALNRRLRVGLVSPDFISHSVAHFIAPLLHHFDRDSLEIYCYSNNRKSDAVTESFRRLATGWRGIAGKNDQSVAELVDRDGIDVLVDLAGHTADNRLGVFLRGPAPMQLTWLGYPTTTGLPRMQYRLSDAVVDPHDMVSFNTETVLRLPNSYFCYMPAQEAPPVSALPFVAQGHITFGSFNNLAKMTDTTLRLWAAVLEAVPNSRLVLKNQSLGDVRVREAFGARLAQAGIDPERVRLIGFETQRTRHLLLYGEIDISLDTFPYNGATTTCESLWMGVPVVTLAGTTHASRMGASLLAAAGQGDLIARDTDQYVGICRGLAGDSVALARRRASLRPSLADSALMDYGQFNRDFENILRSEFEKLIRD
jgi:predicted O-linked N-acetylglucosamine transferase (SPINDLY family)